MFITVFFCGHTCCTLKVSVERTGLTETEHVGGFLNSGCSTSLNESLSLRCDVLLYPFDRGDAVGGSANDFAEVLGGEVEQISVVLYLSRLAVVFYHKVAETVEGIHTAFLCPLPVLVSAIEIEKLVAHGELRQQSLIAVGHLLLSIAGYDVELVNDGEQMLCLLIGEPTYR